MLRLVRSLVNRQSPERAQLLCPGVAVHPPARPSSAPCPASAARSDAKGRSWPGDNGRHAGGRSSIAAEKEQAVIPWAAILRHAPTILAAADALRARTKAARVDDTTRSVDVRLAELEEGSRAAAQVVQEMAQQIHALTLAHESLARRLRVAVGVSATAVVVAIAGALIALLR